MKWVRGLVILAVLFAVPLAAAGCGSGSDSSWEPTFDTQAPSYLPTLGADLLSSLKATFADRPWVSSIRSVLWNATPTSIDPGVLITVGSLSDTPEEEEQIANELCNAALPQAIFSVVVQDENFDVLASCYVNSASSPTTTSTP
jgi:hypothetical protein